MKFLNNLTSAGIICLLLFNKLAVSQNQNSISLAGKWRIAIDGNFKDWPRKVGEEQEWYKSELPTHASLSVLNHIYFKNAEFTVNDWINLPGSTDDAQIGVVLKESATFTPGLERVRTYDGAFWVQRKVTIPNDWNGKNIRLFLERTMGASKVFWNNKKVGEDYGFAFPHVIQIDSAVQSGEHLLTILINKDDLRYAGYGHHLYSGNGSSWNGIIGKIELIANQPKAYIENVQIFPNIQNESIQLKLFFPKGNVFKNKKVNFYFRKKGETEFVFLKSETSNADSMQTNCFLPKPIQLWSEFSPVVYELKCELEYNKKITDTFFSDFGMRQIGREEGYITLNGNKVTMRGTLDNGSFPLTGYPYMEKEKWLEIWKICKSYGLNHIRFHTWCPPKAAFEAADEVGLYLQIELAGSPYSEIDRILDVYGNHPSFCMLSLNNEVMGNTDLNKKVIESAKIKDNRHLYACTTHPVRQNDNDDYFISAWGIEKTDEWPFAKRIVGITWGGGDVIHSSRFNLFPPETQSDFSSEISGLKVPILAHEMGQWAMFPDFDEIQKYKKGVLCNTNYQRIKDKLEKNGMLDLNKKFAKASGMFSSILYKEEIESILRTKGYGGFQLLDLHDYQGQYISIIGILTDFWETKGLVSPKQHSQYCNSIVPLAKMKKRIWQNNEIFNAQIDVSNFSFSDITQAKPVWTLSDTSNHVLFKGNLEPLTLKKGSITSFSEIKIPLKNIKNASKLILEVSIPAINIKNTWEIWVFPQTLPQVKNDANIVETNDFEKAEKLLSEGKKVLLLLDSTHLKQYRESCFSTIFWNSIHKWPQKAHTMGLLCNPNHQIFKHFPTEFHSNWQWWDITMNAFAMNMESLPNSISPLVQVIDSYIVNEKLAYLWECKVGNGKLIVCSIDLTNNLEKRLASKQLKYSILNYMNSNNFNPTENIDFKQIKNLIRTQ